MYNSRYHYFFHNSLIDQLFPIHIFLIRYITHLCIRWDYIGYMLEIDF